MNKKLKVGILGSGNIGTDLLVKILRSDLLECVAFVGRNLNSSGMRKALELGVPISDKSIEAFTSGSFEVDLVFDATSALHHKKHAPLLKNMGIIAIDMTPSQVGDLCVPAINLFDCINSSNLNMVTCGGQSSIPIAYTLKKVVPSVDYIEVVSAISANSAGPGTRGNLDEYINNTEKGLTYFTGCTEVKAIINLNPAKPNIDMQTTIFAKTDTCDLGKVTIAINEMVENIQKYVPGYRLVVSPVFESGRIMIMVRVNGLGDYLPSYAGNLDIINCAAIAVADEYAKRL